MKNLSRQNAGSLRHGSSPVLHTRQRVSPDLGTPVLGGSPGIIRLKCRPSGLVISQAEPAIDAFQQRTMWGSLTEFNFRSQKPPLRLTMITDRLYVGPPGSLDDKNLFAPRGGHRIELTHSVANPESQAVRAISMT
jgi:hypothetical protein